MNAEVKTDPASLISAGRRALEIEERAIAALKPRLDAGFARACHICLACRGRVIVTGMGKSGHIGNKIAATLASTATNVPEISAVIETQPPSSIPTGYEDVLAQLDRAWSYGRGQVAAATGPQLLATRADQQLKAAHIAEFELPPMPFQTAVLWIAGDQHEHLGQLITYARSLGIVPPWSK